VVTASLTAAAIVLIDLQLQKMFADKVNTAGQCQFPTTSLRLGTLRVFGIGCVQGLARCLVGLRKGADRV